MLKVITKDIRLSVIDIPGEITLCVPIANCGLSCRGCHSSEYQKDIPENFGIFELIGLIKQYINKISCVCFMGDPPGSFATQALRFIQNEEIKIAIFTGHNLDSFNKSKLEYLDYLKVGPYIEELGGLSNPKTNQILYKVIDSKLENITYKYWRFNAKTN